MHCDLKSAPTNWPTKPGLFAFANGRSDRDVFASGRPEAINWEMQQVLADPIALSAYLNRVAKEFAGEVVRRRRTEVAGDG